MADLSPASERIDAYIAGLAEPHRSAIAHLRAVVRAAAPEGEEIITYSMPGIGENGALVSYSAFKAHCSLFPMGNAALSGMAEEIAPWRTAKGTLQFTPDNPLPDALIVRIVQARRAENKQRVEARKAKRKIKGA